MRGGSGCTGHGCDDVGCPQGVSVYAAAEPVSDLKSGLYEVLVTADGKLLGCSLSVPESESCRDGDALLVQAYPNGASANPGALYIHLAITPMLLEVRVTRDGVEVGQAKYTVEYTHTRIGSGDCEQECWHSPDERLVTVE